VARLPERVLDLLDAQGTEVEHARGEDRVRAGLDRRGEVARLAGPAAGDHRDGDSRADQADQLEVEAGLRAVGIHRVEQYLARAEVDRAARPVNGVDAGAAAATMRRHLEATGRWLHPCGDPARVR